MSHPGHEHCAGDHDMPLIEEHHQHEHNCSAECDHNHAAEHIDRMEAPDCHHGNCGHEHHSAAERHVDHGTHDHEHQHGPGCSHVEYQAAADFIDTVRKPEEVRESFITEMHRRMKEDMVVSPRNDTNVEPVTEQASTVIPIEPVNEITPQPLSASGAETKTVPIVVHVAEEITPTEETSGDSQALDHVDTPLPQQPANMTERLPIPEPVMHVEMEEPAIESPVQHMDTEAPEPSPTDMVESADVAVQHHEYPDIPVEKPTEIAATDELVPEPHDSAEQVETSLQVPIVVIARELESLEPHEDIAIGERISEILEPLKALPATEIPAAITEIMDTVERLPSELQTEVWIKLEALMPLTTPYRERVRELTMAGQFIGAQPLQSSAMRPTPLWVGRLIMMLLGKRRTPGNSSDSYSWLSV